MRKLFTYEHPKPLSPCKSSEKKKKRVFVSPDKAKDDEGEREGFLGRTFQQKNGIVGEVEVTPMKAKYSNSKIIVEDG